MDLEHLHHVKDTHKFSSFEQEECFELLLACQHRDQLEEFYQSEYELEAANTKNEELKRDFDDLKSELDEVKEHLKDVTPGAHSGHSAEDMFCMYLDGVSELKDLF